MSIYMSHLTNFIKYLDTYEENAKHPDFKLSNMLTAIRDTKRLIAPDVSKSRKLRANERFDKVPSLKLLIERKQQVVETLEEDLHMRALTVNQLKALNFFLLQVRLNCRAGPLLNITWEEYEKWLKNGETIETDEHKTGKHSSQCIIIKNIDGM